MDPVTPAPSTIEPAVTSAPAPSPVSAVASPPPANAKGKRAPHTIIAIVLLLLLYPIGVIYMWFSTKWPLIVKILLSLPAVIGIIAGLIFGFSGHR